MNTILKTLAVYFLLQSSALAVTIGYINIDNLLTNSQQFIDSQVSIEAEFKVRDDKLKVQAATIQEMLTNYQEVKDDLTEEESAEQVNKIKALDANLKNSALKLQKQFELRKEEELQNIQNSINVVINRFALANKFDIILYQNVAFVSDSVDITNKIATELAKNYKK